ncbi:branched-chain amino acid transport system II carrier protein [Lacticaseibacillus paracasei]|uniref:branched-chain amino acid transport system II carrier protein n=1 Tax=Lacticaseibacillus paracasei TaxID=1597 RepID=UPI0025A1748A|nr:branched-chain amino acid transport system II carrier protein [Lacticaseibacillus paracasei]MDM7530163.1 branched-chain amino acid transport system II carrier protein [Lacticaseibacillus paracasei]MDM7541494.1 branched-chain amino acid transport system II carrier protein [Lacticaseibacillus paracasei]
MELSEKKLKTRDYVVIASLLFGLFFGAGNLIFPLHLGQLAGANWFPAMLGFLVTAVALPLLGVLAIAATHAEGVYDIGRPLGRFFALAFMVLIHATIGPMFGTPRTATVSFTTGVLPMLPKAWAQVGLLVFSALFFAATFFLSYKERKITTAVGKILNPVFLVLLFFVFFIGFSHPMGNPATQTVTAAYKNASFMNGFLQGYNTMDALAALAFGVTVVTAVRGLGLKNDDDVAKSTAKAGVMATSWIGLIYVALILLGSMSLAHFKLSPEGGTAFNQVVTYYFGAAGHAVLATLLTLTCLTTAVGLVAAFAQDFHRHCPKVSYRVWLALTSFLSFLTANFGLEQIIAWSVPMLMFLYPFSMVLILLSVFGKAFHHDPLVYRFVVGFTAVPAVLDMFAAFPAFVSQSALGLALHSFQLHFLPFAGMGLGWLVPAGVGLAVGLVAQAVKVRKAVAVAKLGAEEN